MKKYTYKEIMELPTIEQGHFDNLKVSTKTRRVWISRMTLADGMCYNNQITIERLIRGNWFIIDQYEAR